jgi:uncharacterized membrane protein YdbT with pleckstrin-like domain
MIPTNQEQRLGRRTWHLLLMRNVSAALGFILLAVIFGLAKDFIAKGLPGFLTLNVKNLMATQQAIGAIVSIIALCLLGIGVLLFVYGYIVSRLHYRNFTFTLEEYGIKLKKGIFDIKEISIPYRQIQNVDVSKSLAYQFFGVSRLVIITAGQDDDKSGDETESVFDPIDSDIAEEIRMILQKRIGVQVVEDENQADKEMVGVSS